MLQAQTALNQLRNVDAFKEAVGAARGRLWVPLVNYTEPGNFGAVKLSAEETAGAEAVDVVTLDEELSDLPCALLKIDVEGMERDVIAGGVNLIKDRHPLIYVENDRAENSSALVSLLLGLGYRLWWHITWLYNQNNFYGAHENIYRNTATYNMFCCHGAHEAAAGLVEIKSPDDPYPHKGYW
jgi:FkbM family methyltransferase